MLDNAWKADCCLATSSMDQPHCQWWAQLQGSSRNIDIRLCAVIPDDSILVTCLGFLTCSPSINVSISFFIAGRVHLVIPHVELKSTWGARLEHHWCRISVPDQLFSRLWVLSRSPGVPYICLPDNKNKLSLTFALLSSLYHSLLLLGISLVDESSADDLKCQAAPNLASGLSYAYDRPDETSKVNNSICIPFSGF